MEQKIFEIMDENPFKQIPNQCSRMFRVVSNIDVGKKATSKYYHIYSNQRKQKRKS